MRMRTLIDLCRSHPDFDVIIVLDGVPQGVDDADSYRGFYEQVALQPTNVRHTWKANALAGTLAELMVSGMQGYRGGHYTPDDDTAVWVSPYGESARGMILGGATDEAKRQVVLTAFTMPEEYI